MKKLSVNPPIKITSSKYKGSLPIDRLQLPEGFEIDVYAEDIKNARSMSLSPNGTLFIGTRSAGNVYALKDSDQDGKIDQKWTLMEGGNMPNGVAYKDGDLYIAEVNRILKFSNIEERLDDPGTPEVIYDQYPTEKHHGWKYIAFGPDGKLYVPVGAPCNICESEDPIFNSLTRINPDGTGFEIVQQGIRNTVGFTWHPDDQSLWFTDNGRDWMGDNRPDCELNTATNDGNHYGYPYCHQGDLLDPDFGEGKDCSDYIAPVVKLGPHTAPLGLEFYSGNNFPQNYQKELLICRHGSWNRKEKIGYDVVHITQNESGKLEMKPFVTGWLSEDKKDVWGRPVDVEMMPDRSVLISDDYADAIYRIYYVGE
jgi:glucose/arabinose dehydrogenase